MLAKSRRLRLRLGDFEVVLDILFTDGVVRERKLEGLMESLRARLFEQRVKDFNGGVPLSGPAMNELSQKRVRGGARFEQMLALEVELRPPATNLSHHL